MKIRWTHTPILGAFHGRPDSINTGDVVDLDPVHAKRYIKHEMAEPIDHDAAGAHF